MSKGVKSKQTVGYRGERAKEHAALYACARTNAKGGLFQAAKARMGTLLKQSGSTSATAENMGVSVRSVQRLLLMLKLRERDASKDTSRSSKRTATAAPTRRPRRA